MEIIQLRRKFIWKHGSEEKELPDPGSELTPDEVLELHTVTYPELTTGSLQGPTIEDDYEVYRISSAIGKKG